jgi:uncharacterized protein (DUF1330 family)
MTAYVIAELGAVHTDDARVARLDKTGLGKFGERLLVDSSNCEPLTGTWTPQRIAVLEFPTVELAWAWWSASQRSGPRELKPVERKMILIEGL